MAMQLRGKYLVSAGFLKVSAIRAAKWVQRAGDRIAAAKSIVESKMSAKSHSLRRTCPAWTPSAASSFAVLSFVALLPPLLLHGQATSIEIPSATPLSIQLLQHVPMKAGEPLEGRLLYPVYIENRIALPAGTLLRGSVVQLDSDRSRRIHSRLRGDFTPFHIPVVRFDQMVLTDGTLQPIVSGNAKDGVPILRLSPPSGKPKGSFIRRQIAQEKQRLKDIAALFTKPGRGDRLVQFIYTQLPYHPERIEAATAWTVELAQPLELTHKASSPAESSDPITQVQRAGDKSNASTTQNQETEWRLRAYLQKTISSANEKQGDTFQAVVTEPIFNANHVLAVPEGSVLVGEITQAKAARSFGRQGKLRFRFRELKFPTGFSEPVEGTLAGVDSDKSANLQIDSEGGIQPKSQNRVIVPLVLTLLAGRAFDDDGSAAANGAVASNGFGIVGRVVGIVASSRNVAAGIGIYGAALSFYDLWLARGHNVVFVKNTRVEITTTPTRSPMNVKKNEKSR